jgi:hypothetical protein
MPKIISPTMVKTLIEPDDDDELQTQRRGEICITEPEFGFSVLYRQRQSQDSTCIGKYVQLSHPED